MQLQRAQKVRLGLFVVSALGLLAACVVALLGASYLAPHRDYRTRFNESIAGLERNAPVRYQGLRIGRVDALYVAPDDPTRIEVVLALDPCTPLYAGTVAQLDMSGLTGLKNINLRPGDPRGGKLAAGSMLPSAPSMLGRLSDNADAILGDLRQVADQLGAFVNPNNTRALGRLVLGVDKLVDHVDQFLVGERSHLSSTLHEAETMTHAVRRAAEETTTTVTEVRGMLGGVGKQIEETLQAVRLGVQGVEGAEVQRTVVHVGEAARALHDRLGQAEAGATMAAIKTTVGRVDHLVGDVDLAVRAGREDFARSLSYLRQAAEDLREFSRILASNPSVLVRGRGEEE